MKRTIRLISSLVVAFALMATMGAGAFAASGQVTYQGDAGSFLFEPGSEYSPSDLFTGQKKGVMPGDTLTHTINVRNDASKAVDVEIFIKSLGAAALEDENVTAEQSADFLEHMTLTVTDESGATLSDAQADQTAGLTDWVSLGKFKSGADVDLTICLQVPMEMGNDCAAQIGAIDWVFKVVETPVPATDKPDADDNAKTGDSTALPLIIGICIAALAVAVIAIVAGRRRRQE